MKALLTACVLAAAAAIVTHAQTPAGSAAITGTVIDASTGRPLDGAVVTMEDRRAGRVVRVVTQRTTPKGRFAFVDLSAGPSYTVTTSMPGYLDGGYHRLDPQGPAAPIALADAQWMPDVRIALSRPGSISGVVLDERGEPIVGVFVRVLARALIAGRVQWLSGTSTRTDDRGMYRIAGLAPGTFIVSVPSVQATMSNGAAIRDAGANAGRSMIDLSISRTSTNANRLLVDAGGGQQSVVGSYSVPPVPAADGGRTAYPIAFYPNASRVTDATPVTIGLSEDRAGIDIQLQPVRVARVSGVLQGPVDAIGGLLLRLMPAGLEALGQGSEAATTVTTSAGQFTFLDVPAGTYVLLAQHDILDLTYAASSDAQTGVPPPIPFPTRSAASSSVLAASPGVQYAALRDLSAVNYRGQIRIDVPTTDLDDVVVPMHKTATMRGRIVYPIGTTPPPDAPPGKLEPANGSAALGLPSTSSRSVPETTTFMIDGLLAGEYVLRFSGSVIESITWNGKDYTERPFDASAGTDINDVVVTFGTAASTISGTVITSIGTNTNDASAVIVFPVERDAWTNYGLSPRRLRSVLTSTDTHYEVTGLPNGEYYVIAVPASLERAWLDPAFLASHAGTARRVRIERGGSTVPNIALAIVK